MEKEITYKVNAQELKELILDPLRKEVKAEMWAKFNERIIDAKTVAIIHGVSIDTVYEYANRGEIKCIERTGANTKLKFRLGDALEFDFKELRRKLRRNPV